MGSCIWTLGSHFVALFGGFYGSFRRWSPAHRNHCGWDLEPHSCPTSSSLSVSCVMKCDPPFSCCSAGCHVSPTAMGSPSWTVSHKPLSLPFGHGVLSKQQKVTNTLVVKLIYICNRKTRLALNIISFAKHPSVLEWSWGTYRQSDAQKVSLLASWAKIQLGMCVGILSTL